MKFNSSVNLVPDPLATDIEQKPTRHGFGDGLVVLGKIHENVVAICADLTESTRVDAFRKAFPSRYIEVGITEQHMAAFASGLASIGKIPFIASYAMFSPGRNWEQIRTTICYNDMPVKIVGAHAGVSVGPDGATHQALEDIALMRVLPRMTVIVPCDALEAQRATEALYGIPGPCYLRLTREATPVWTTAETPFQVGKALMLAESDHPDVVIIGCGPILHEALRAAKKLFEQGIHAEVLNMHTVKPIDRDAITRSASRAGAVVSVEEHQINGGLGSAIAEVLGETHPVPLERIGIRDHFGESGTPAELVEEFGLTASAIVNAVQRVIKRKRKT